MMRKGAERRRTNRKAAVKPLFALVSLLLSVIWLWNNAALCVASTRVHATSSTGSSAGSSVSVPACHCLKCTMMGSGMSGGMLHGMKSCCCCGTNKSTGKNPVCMRALCDSEDEAMARAVWLPPTLPVATWVACPPSVAPLPLTPVIPSRRLTARTIAPLAQPPRSFSFVKKNRRFPLS